MFTLSGLREKDIFIDIPETDFNSIVFHIIHNSAFFRKKELFNAVIDREKLLTTAIGNNAAIPHCRLNNFTGTYVKFALFKNGDGYLAANREKIKFMFLIIGSRNDTAYYLHTLSHIALIMRNDNLREELLQAVSKKEIKQIFSNCEHKKSERRVHYAWK